MISGVYNIPTQVNGDTFDGVQFTLTSTVDSVTTPIDLTDCLLFSQIKDSKGIVVRDMSISNGITVTDAVNGVFRIDSFLLTIGVGVFVYDIQLIYNSGVVKTYIKGQLTVVPDITK